MKEDLFDEIKVCRIDPKEVDAELVEEEQQPLCMKHGGRRIKDTMDAIEARIPITGKVRDAFREVQRCAAIVEEKQREFIELSANCEVHEFERMIGELNLAKCKACRAEEKFGEMWYSRGTKRYVE